MGKKKRWRGYLIAIAAVSTLIVRARSQILLQLQRTSPASNHHPSSFEALIAGNRAEGMLPLDKRSFAINHDNKFFSKRGKCFEDRYLWPSPSRLSGSFHGNPSGRKYNICSVLHCRLAHAALLVKIECWKKKKLLSGDWIRDAFAFQKIRRQWGGLPRDGRRFASSKFSGGKFVWNLLGYLSRDW